MQLNSSSIKNSIKENSLTKSMHSGFNKSKLSESPSKQGEAEGQDSIQEDVADGQEGDNAENDEDDSMDSFDPAAEYEKQKAAEQERLKIEMEEQLKVELANMYKKMKDHIIPFENTKLPTELPKDLIYWHRCDTFVCNQDLITNEWLQDFYQTEFKWHEDNHGEVGKVSDNPPFF